MQLTREYLLWLFHYDRENGKLYWKNHWCNATKGRFLGKQVGNLDVNGYLRVTINYKRYLVHRIIFFLESRIIGNFFIDHINGDTIDNRILNLRVSNNRRNQQNQHKHRNGKLVGTSFHKVIKKWQSRIVIKKKNIHLGYFDTEIEAHQRYVQELKARGLS